MRTFQHMAKLVRLKRSTHPENYSQTDLSLLLGYKNGQFISNVERGLCSIPLKMVPLLCEVLHIPLLEVKEAMLADFSATFDQYAEQEAKKVIPREVAEDQKIVKEKSYRYEGEEVDILANLDDIKKRLQLFSEMQHS
jgi:hypothetical protein